MRYLWSVSTNGQGDEFQKIIDECDNLLNPACMNFEDPDAEFVGRRDVCNVCGVGNCRLKKCGGCGMACYCSSKCQTYHWPSHKKICKPFKL